MKQLGLPATDATDPAAADDGDAEVAAPAEAGAGVARIRLARVAAHRVASAARELPTAQAEIPADPVLSSRLEARLGDAGALVRGEPEAGEADGEEPTSASGGTTDV